MSASHNRSNLLFGASYYPQHYPESSWPQDFEMMLQAGVNALRVGDFAWPRLQPEENRWEFGWLDRWMDLAAEAGIGVLLVPPIRCAPAWLMEKEPEIGIVNESGVRLEFGSRYTFCINHPALREGGLEVARRMAERYGNHTAVIGWHLDNEYGDEPDCHCEICKSKWHGWLEQRYGTVEALNKAWGSVFWGLEWNHFGQIPTPRVTKTYQHPALLLAWRQFRSDCTVEIMQLHAEATKQGEQASGGEAKYITSNLQNQWNVRTDYFALKGVLDVAGMNYYPPFGEACRDNALGMTVLRGILGKNIQIHELRNGPHTVPGRPDNTPAPGEVERLTLHCIGHGSDAIYYFQWRGVPFGPEQSHGTPCGYDGRPLRVYSEVQQTGLKLREIAPVLEGTEVKSDIALLYDFPTRWSMLGNPEWIGPGNLYGEQAKRVFNAVRRNGLNCDAIGRYEDFEKYKILVAPIFDCLEEEVVDRLCAYVNNGGVLVWHALCGTKNRETELYLERLHPKLAKLFGVNVRDVATGADAAFQFQWRERTYSGYWFADLVKSEGAEVLGAFAQSWFKGTPAVVLNRVGQGRAYYVATPAGLDFYQDFLGLLAQDAGLENPLGAPVPAEIEVLERSAPDGRKVLFLLNCTGREQKLALPYAYQDVWNDEALGGEVRFAPHQVRVCIPVMCGDGRW